jgi:DNA topoisomerase II
LTNIYSLWFLIEIIYQGQKYVQKWSDNMLHKTEPVITKVAKDAEGYTKITFKPDLAKFGMTEFDSDIINLFHKRVYDLAATTRGVKVYLNDFPVPFAGFEQYVALYPTTSPAVLYQTDRWQVGVGFSDEGFQQVLFVNGVWTAKGGKLYSPVFAGQKHF